MAYLAGAFAVAWILVFGFVFTLVQRQGKLEQDIAVLRELVEGRQPK
jgi:CcmD family protein